MSETKFESADEPGESQKGLEDPVIETRRLKALTRSLAVRIVKLQRALTAEITRHTGFGEDDQAEDAGSHPHWRMVKIGKDECGESIRHTLPDHSWILEMGIPLVSTREVQTRVKKTRATEVRLVPGAHVTDAVVGGPNLSGVIHGAHSNQPGVAFKWFPARQANSPCDN